jgi:hypothetical protein
MFNSLFSFPYYKVKIPPESYNKEKIVSTAMHNYSKSPVRNKWNCDSSLHHAYNDLKNPFFDKIDYSSVIPIYKSIIKKFIDNLKFIDDNFYWNFEIQNYTVTTENQNMSSHHHMPAVFTAIHYVKFNSDQHNPTLFHNPSKYSPVLGMFYNEQQSIFDCNDVNNSWIWNTTMIPTEEDDFIITPAIVDHSIIPSKSLNERITIALNIHLNKKNKIKFLYK